MTTRSLLQFASFASFAFAITGCLNNTELEGEYEMTYDVILSPAGSNKLDVRAGLTDVHVRPGLATEYLIDLGPSLCRLEGIAGYASQDAYQYRYLDIRPQPCWFAAGATTYMLSVSGSAAYGTSDRFSIVLAGSFVDETSDARGTVTLELTESW
jgi:hypothetical protein